MSEPSASAGDRIGTPANRAAVELPGRGDALLLVVAVCAVSTSGPIMATVAAPALAVAFWRNALGAAASSGYALVRHRSELVGLGPRRIRAIALSGLLLALHFAMWVPSLRLTSVASATALVCTQPLWSVLITRLQGRAVAGRVWVGLAVALGGAVLITGVDVAHSGRALVGDLLALAGGVFAAGYVAVGESVRRTVSTASYTSICYSVAALVLLGACLVGRESLGGYSARTWVLLAILTLLAQLLGHSIVNHVLESTSATVVSLVLLFEVPGAALIAALWLGETPPAAAVPAIGLLLAGLGLVVSARSRSAPPVLPTE